MAKYRIVERDGFTGKVYVVQRRCLGLFWLDWVGDRDGHSTIEEAMRQIKCAQSEDKVVYP